MSPTSFIALLLPAARAAAKEFGVPVSITLGQAALESSWGVKAPGNNYFGVKADKSWAGPVVTFGTHEHLAGKDVAMPDKFRAYSTLDESVRDHAKFIKENPRYAPCFAEKDFAGWARALQAARYATAPNYADMLIAVINGRKMQQYDA